MIDTTIVDRRDRERVVNEINDLDLTKRWRVSITNETQRRTLSQNALYWMWIDGVVRAVSEHTGYDKNDVHEFLKRKFLAPRRVRIGDDARAIYSTKKLDTKQMAQFTNDVYRWATTELSLTLPLPEEMQRR